MVMVSGIGAIAGELIKVPTRADIKTTVFWHSTEGATATLFIYARCTDCAGVGENANPYADLDCRH